MAFLTDYKDLRGKRFVPPGATDQSRVINPSDIYKPSAPIILAAGPNGNPTQFAFQSRYLSVISATYPDDIELSFDGRTFQPWPSGITFTEIPDVAYVYIRNQNASANTVRLAAGSAKIQDNRLVAAATVTVNVKQIPSTAASGPSAFSSVVSATLAAANTSRRGLTIMNPVGNPTLHVNLGSGAAVVNQTGVSIVGGAYYEVPYSYTGIITAIMAAAGTAYWQELT